MAERKLRLSDRRIGEIRALAWRCLVQIECTSPKVPVEAVAKRLGAEIVFAPNAANEVAGVLVYRGGQAVIGVNSSHHSNRQRFTIAHECGHLLLGHGKAFVDKHFAIHRGPKSSEGTDRLEIEANQFAAELLMPLRFMLRDLRGVDFESDEAIERLAARYGVSRAAMSYRIAKIFM